VALVPQELLEKLAGLMVAEKPGLLGVRVLAIFGGSRWRGVLAGLAAIATLYCAGWLRYDLALMLEYDQSSERDPDVLNYIEEAGKARGFYHISIREPLFIFVGRMAPRLVGPPPYWAMRVQSIAFGVALIGVTYLIGIRLYGAAVGLGAAIPMAINPMLVFQDQRGLREQLYALLMLTLVYVLFLRRDWPLGLRYVMAGVLAGAMSLVRITGLEIFLVLLATALLAESDAWRVRVIRGGVSLGLAALLIAPYIYGCARQLGDPFVSVNAHAIFWRNVEFGGQPGFPSREALQANNYLGRPVTTAEYVFGMHTPWEVLVRHLRGYWHVLGTLLVVDGRGWLYLLFGVVGLFMLALRRRWWFPIAMFASVLPVAFVASLPVGFETPAPIDRRFLIPIFPFFFLAAAYAAVAGAAGAFRKMTASTPGFVRSRVARMAAGGVAFAVVLGAAVYGDGREWRYREYLEDFNDGGRRAARHAERITGWSDAPYGLGLSPGGRGEVTYRFWRLWFTRVRVQLWLAYHPGATHTSVEVSRDGRRFEAVARDRHFAGDWLDLTERVRGAVRFHLRIAAEYPVSGGGGIPVVVVDRLRVVRER
jgi:hypothetical protein